jgi:hypothetical protein
MAGFTETSSSRRPSAGLCWPAGSSAGSRLRDDQHLRPGADDLEHGQRPQAVDLVGPVAGVIIAVGVAYVLRGPAKAQEAAASEGTPLDRAV